MDATTGWGRTAPPPPVRHVHLGLGAFARAHAVVFTDAANQLVDAPERWGVAGFTGRSGGVARTLAAQDGRYHLVVRGAEGDAIGVVDALVEARDGADADRWRDRLSRAEVGVVTLTVTETGYRATGTGADAVLDTVDPEVRADLALLRSPDASAGGGPACRTAPGRLVDGLRARRAAAAGPIALVPCDNLPANGVVLRAVVRGMAALVDEAHARWIDAHVSFVSTVVDRITPATVEADRTAVRAATGTDDAAPVVTEPFREWVLAGEFPAGRPAWEQAGARFVPDVAPYERRKLWLLNAGHSLLAYAGLPHGHRTVADAVADTAIGGRLEALWSEAAAVLGLPEAEVEAATTALRHRFANPRIEHRLEQIARDGSQKLPVRVLDVVRARRAAGLPVGGAGVEVLADWAAHLRRCDVAHADPRALELAERLRTAAPADVAALVVAALAPDLAADHAFVDRLAAAVDARLAVPATS
ncbi:mannitol dehydrogenase family protein [Cellulomonas endophytica]|uniref:mannitol dehydrogenase family protein n=1 Tax=Cellulomonas endophytica TaxID=2494735 RepID=UPI0010100DF3|nr:mannitol dehydrogenase family protein [Cellulomonas endophytica]